MQELTLSEIQKISTETLERFDSICKKYNLRYSVAYGTMLGAVRHGGFIPWDDDADVQMPREDYEKLIKLQYEDDEYKILHYSYCDNFFYTFAKMVDKRTDLKEPYRGEKNMGVYIDIFPVDYVGDYDTEAPKNVEKAWKSCKFWEHLGSDIKVNKSFSPKYLAKLVFRGAVFPFRKRMLRHFDFAFAGIKESEYCAVLQEGYYKMGECFPTKLWDELAEYDFDGIKVLGFKDYDKYLSTVFGDYMTPPPVERRRPCHSFKAYKK